MRVMGGVSPKERKSPNKKKSGGGKKKRGGGKKKRGRDSHAEQYRPSDRDCGLWKMATRGVMKTLVLDDDGAPLI
jgi:hypothetical protein